MNIPKDIKIKLTIELVGSNPEDLLFMIRDHERFWPGYELVSFAVTGSVAGEATAALIVSNYDLSEDYEETEEAYDE